MTNLVSPDDIRFFEENGYLHLKNVIGAEELAALREFERKVSAAARVSRIPCPDYRYTADPRTGQNSLHQIIAAELRGGAFLDLFGNPDVLSIGDALIGSEFLPFLMILVVKRPGYGVSVPWHRDPSNYRVRPGINAGIYLDDATEENGMLYVVPGSHKDTGTDPQELVEEHGFHIPGSIPVAARAGDVVLHSEDLLHGSRVVRATTIRRVMYYGFQSIAEMTARGGKYNPAWVRYRLRMVGHAIRTRANSPVGLDETPYQWKLPPEYMFDLEPDEYVEMRIDS